MSITDAISAKFNRVKEDYQKEQRLKRAADVAYKNTYQHEHGKNTITNAVKQAKADAKAGKKSGGGLGIQFNPDGFMQALDTSVMGTPKRAAPKAKPKTKQSYNTIKVDGHTIQLPKKQKKKQQTQTGFEVSPFVFDL